MARLKGTKRNSEPFDEATVSAVWEKGRTVTGYDAGIWRQDTCGAWMKRSDHGNTQSEYGWEIDHITPVAAGGGDELSNLQPLHWQNNRGKGDDYPTWKCTISGT